VGRWGGREAAFGERRTSLGILPWKQRKGKHAGRRELPFTFTFTTTFTFT
jgi:hypothetical protein